MKVLLGFELVSSLISPIFEKYEKVQNARLNKQSYEAVHRLHFSWYMTSIKALMGQLGKEIFRELNPEDQVQFARCLDNIDNQGDLTYGARCLVKARRRRDINPLRTPINNSKSAFVQAPELRRKTIKFPQQIQKSANQEFLKPVVIKVKGRFDRVRPEISSLYRQRKLKAGKDKSRFWQFESYLTKSDNDIIKVKSMDRLNSLAEAPKTSAIRKVTNLITRITQDKQTTYKPGDWVKTYNHLLDLKETMEEKKQMPGARAFDYRLFDLVMDNDKPTKSPKEKMHGPSLMDAAIDLVESVTGKKNRKVREQSNVRFMSPRIAPLMPDKMETKSRHLSPSILAFYNDEAEGGIASIPKVLEATGMTPKDRDSVIEMLMEVSGARKNVNMALDILNHLNFRGLKGEVLEVTERLSGAFKTLAKSFFGYQEDDIKNRGFTFLETNQIERIYRDHGVNNPNDVDFNLHEYGNLSRSDREAALWERIELLAENTTETHHRHKRTLVSIASPTVLSPYMFTPIFGLSILGPVVLSPSLFSPLILNPSVLGPFVLSPAVAMPFILSPYLLSPYVLTPIVMAPFILNPYVLSPNIINPYVLSPLVLSPLVLCPDVLSPQALGGAILSPSVASPAVLTESYLMASVLSPSFLS
ncbi:hypothetical protein QR680_000435 [Steinernema hermaphroditum]|uniref:Uncharacterized protein n=1 Tax=Steinernema hermaphroditum TaxID=289476 RepID=A0AA39GUK8_9BILA|nr:hypothetical protein QR680_000435 [Steinernema hermaphroditum]